MQGKSRMDRELLDAGEMAGHLVPAGSVFAFLAEHRRYGSRTSGCDLREDMAVAPVRRGAAAS